MKTLILLLIFTTGCTSTHLEYGDIKFNRITFGTKVSIPELSGSGVVNGVTNKFTLRGYSNDGTQAIEAAARGAAQGAK